MPVRHHRYVIVVAILIALPMTAANQPSGCQGMTCEERADAAYDYIYDVLNDNLSCQVDEDCTTISIGTDCQGMCPAPVAVDGVDEVSAAVTFANETWCDGYMEDGCPYMTPSCLAIDPVCDQGTCVGQAQ